MSDDLTDEQMEQLARVLEILKRQGIELIPVKDDGTPETVQ